MRNIKFDVNVHKYSGDRTMKVSAECYGSAAEVVSTMLKRKVKIRSADCIEDTGEDHWIGIQSGADLQNRARTGLDKPDLIKEIQRRVVKVQCEDKDKLALKIMSVAGGCPDIPTFLSSDPMCMHSVARKRVPSRIITIGVCVEICCGVSIKDYETVGGLLCELVAMLERMGYRVRLLAFDALTEGYNHLSVLSVNIKHENESMNFKRIMFPLTDMAFERGLAFSWIARKPDYPFSGLGGYTDSYFESAEQKIDVFRRVSGQKECVVFTIHDLIDYYHMNGEEKTRKLLLMKVSSVM